MPNTISQVTRREKLKIKKARVQDAKKIHSLINKFAKKIDMLPRSLSEIYESIRDFSIVIEDDKVIAVAALHILWDDLAEIRSMAVSKNHQGLGIGKQLIKKSIREARDIGVKKVFALTYHPDFFKGQGFEDIDKNELPHKIWGDCQRCPKFPDCNELAVIKYL